MKKLQIFQLLVAAVSTAVLASCGADSQPSPTDSESAADKKPQVALIMKSLANEFFKTMADGAKAHSEANPNKYDLTVNGIKNETDISQQVALVEQMIAKKVDAIVIAPADSKALITVLKRAQSAGIIVVNIDNKLDTDVLTQAGVSIPFVGPDNREGAKIVGAALAKELPEAAKVAILEGVPTALNAQQRRAGFEDAMTDAGAEIVSIQSAQWEMDKANQISSAILQKHPDLSAILASNDSMALGAVSAIKAAGKTDEVKVVGFDNISAVQALIKEGRVFATADQHGGGLAVFGIEAALDILGGNTPADKKTPVDLVTKETL